PLPVLVSGTITDISGRTLIGQTIEAFWHSVSHFDMLSVGLNCALGAGDMRPYVETLSGLAHTFINCHPNQGMPDGFGGFSDTPASKARAAGEVGRNAPGSIVRAGRAPNPPTSTT